MTDKTQKIIKSMRNLIEKNQKYSDYQTWKLSSLLVDELEQELSKSKDLKCRHGIILYGNRCLNCEREEQQSKDTEILDLICELLVKKGNNTIGYVEFHRKVQRIIKARGIIEAVIKANT
jgi:hypothetical protein